MSQIECKAGWAENEAVIHIMYNTYYASTGLGTVAGAATDPVESKMRNDRETWETEKQEGTIEP